MAASVHASTSTQRINVAKATKRQQSSADMRGPWAKATSKDLAALLADSTFVDYFNVFLAQPVFPQRLVYKFDEKDFDFDPPVQRTKYCLDRQRLVQWILRERLPLFYDTELYLEYVLCQEFLATSPSFCTDHLNQDYDGHRHREDTGFIRECIGHVIGMGNFRRYVCASPGEKVYQCLVDIRRFHHIPKEQVTERWLRFREIQIKYFRRNGLPEVADSWENFSDASGMAGGYPSFFRKDLTNDAHWQAYLDPDAPPNEKQMNSNNLDQLQNLLLAILKDYWLQKYILHCKAEQLKRDDPKTLHKIHSRSDLTILKDVKNIDKALALLQGNLRRGLRVKGLKSLVSWRAMFPENTVDDSFLHADGDEIVTQESGSAGAANDQRYSNFEQMLKRYLSSDDSSDDSVEPRKRSSVTKSADSETGKSTDSRGSCNSSLSSRSSITQQPSTEKTDPDVDAKQSVLPPRLTKDNLTLFEGLLQLNFETIPREAFQNGDTSDRPKSSPATDRGKHLLQKASTSTKNNKKVRSSKDKTTTSSVVKKNTGSEPTLSKGVREDAPLENLRYLLGNGNPEVNKLHLEADVTKPHFEYKNTSEGNYRHDNRSFVMAVTSDNMAGKPFESYLKRRKQAPITAVLNFYHDSQTYLATKATSGNNINDCVNFRRAKVLLVRHLSGVGKNMAGVPQSLMLMMERLLPEGKGDDLLRQAEDFVLQALAQHWQNFCKQDVTKFKRALVEKSAPARRGRGAPPRSTSVPPNLAREHSLSQQAKSADDVLDNQQGETTGQRSNQNKKTQGATSDGGDALLKKDSMESDHRRTLALQMALDIAHSYEEGLPFDALDTKCLEYDVDQPHGSLAIKPLVKVKRIDLEQEAARQRYLVQKARDARKEALEESRLVKVQKLELHSDDKPCYMRSFKRHGQWHHRPPKPRSFTEILRCPTSMEFFRRYLTYEGAETPLIFFLAVEDLKKCKDSKSRQAKVIQMQIKYFSTAHGKGIGALECGADVIYEISRMDRPPPSALLISAQTCVVRSLEENWFAEYLATFTDIKDNSALNVTMKLLSDGGKRTWGKKRTRSHWHMFVRAVIRFRNGVLNPQTFKLFEDYLKVECKKEIEKQRQTSGQAYVHGLPVKKIIRNKLVDVTKLTSDLSFFSEAERYRAMFDHANEAAKEGNYSVHDQVALEKKATTIVDCFIDSELPPKIQINITQETSENILEAYNNNIIDRGLFHEATITIFPVLVYMWKRFQKYRFANMFEDFEQKRKAQTAKTSFRVGTPDYLNISSLKSRRIAAHHDEDHPRVLFSLAHGARLVLPGGRDTTMGGRRQTIFQARASVFYAEGGSMQNLLGELQGDGESGDIPPELMGMRRQSIFPYGGGRRMSGVPGSLQPIGQRRVSTVGQKLQMAALKGSLLGGALSQMGNNNKRLSIAGALSPIADNAQSDEPEKYHRRRRVGIFGDAAANIESKFIDQPPPISETNGMRNSNLNVSMLLPNENAGGRRGTAMNPKGSMGQRKSIAPPSLLNHSSKRGSIAVAEPSEVVNDTEETTEPQLSKGSRNTFRRNAFLVGTVATLTSKSPRHSIVEEDERADKVVLPKITTQAAE